MALRTERETMAKNDQCNTGETDWVTDNQQAMLSFQESILERSEHDAG